MLGARHVLVIYQVALRVRECFGRLLLGVSTHFNIAIHIGKLFSVSL